MQPAALQLAGLPYELIQVGVAQTLELRLQRDNHAIQVDSGTITITSPAGEVIVNEAAINAGYPATYLLASTLVDDADPGEGWGIRWDVTVSGEAISYALPAIMVLRKLVPRIGDADIKRRFPHLDASDPYSVTRAQTWQPMIDDAWRTIQIRLIEGGRRPWLISDYAALTEPHILLAAARIHDTLAARGSAPMAEQADRLFRQYELAFSRATIRYAEGSDGTEGTEPRKGAAGSLRLVRAPRRWWR